MKNQNEQCFFHEHSRKILEFVCDSQININFFMKQLMIFKGMSEK